MKILFDTHAFMWWHDEPEKLSKRVHELCLNPENMLMLSVVSVWEMQIKAQLGKLTLKNPLPQIVEMEQKKNQLEILSVHLEHIFALEQLPLHHGDPFDRLLIAQTIVEEAALLTKDQMIARYPVHTEW